MKRFLSVLTVSAFVAISASASDYTYKCKQRTDRSPVDPSVGKISVVLTHIRNLASSTNYRGQYADSVDSVKVVVTGTIAGRTSVLKSVAAIAVSEDVMYNIDNNGIKFHTYMDELEESGIEFKLNGKKVDVSLTCDV